jgi:RNA polymerase sigma-70 factor (ECF subfamily)
MIKASEGDEKTFTEIYISYFSVVASFISSLDGQFQASEDITQDVFMRIWDDRKKYRPTSSLKTFLFTYARNVFYEYKSKKNKEKALFVADSNVALEAIEAKTDSEDEIRATAKLPENLISPLPDKQKRVFELVYLCGVTPKEVAKQLECSLHSVHQNLYLARKTIRKLLIN